MEPVLRVENLSLSASGVSLLSDVDLRIDRGEIVAIIGPNGAGKTSLIRAISGEVIPSNGRAIFAGRPLQAIPINELAKSMAVLPQFSRLDFPFVAEDVVKMGRMPHGSGLDVDSQIVADTMKVMDINNLSQRLYTRLSGGERQRVQLARAFTQIWRAEDALERLLILDEPSSSLDISHTQQLMRTVQRMAKNGVAVIMAVHDFNMAVRYADRIIAMTQGQIVAAGPAEEVMTEKNMHDIFQVSVSIVPHPQTNKPMVFIND